MRFMLMVAYQLPDAPPPPKPPPPPATPPPRRPPRPKPTPPAEKSPAPTRTAPGPRTAAGDPSAPAAARRGHGFAEHRQEEGTDTDNERGRQRSGDEPGQHADDATHGERSQQPAQHRAQDTAEDQQGEQPKRIEQIEIVHPIRILPLRHRRRQFLAVDHRDHLVDAGRNAAGEIAAS